MAETKKNWKTTTVGILSGVGILIQQAIAVLDDDPTTEWNMAAIATALAAFGIGWFARDKDVSSKSSGVE